MSSIIWIIVMTFLFQPSNRFLIIWSHMYARAVSLHVEILDTSAHYYYQTYYNDFSSYCYSILIHFFQNSNYYGFQICSLGNSIIIGIPVITDSHHYVFLIFCPGNGIIISFGHTYTCLRFPCTEEFWILELHYYYEIIIIVIIQIY